jgi:hypothetical protein
MSTPSVPRDQNYCAAASLARIVELRLDRVGGAGPCDPGIAAAAVSSPMITGSTLNSALSVDAPLRNSQAAEHAQRMPHRAATVTQLSHNSA